MAEALAAIADDGNFFSFDQIEIGIVIVVDAHGLPSLAHGAVDSCGDPVVDVKRFAGFLLLGRDSGPHLTDGHGDVVANRLETFRAAGDGNDPCPADFGQPQGLHQMDEAVDLVGSAGDLEHEALGGAVHQARMHEIRNAQRLHQTFAIAGDLDQRQFALDDKRRPW